MIANVIKTEEWLRLNECIWWEVSSREQSNSTVFETDLRDPLETRFSKFRQAMDICRAGRFIIFASKKEDDRKTRLREEFSNLENLAASSGSPTSSIAAIPENYISKQEVESLIAKERLTYKLDRMEEDLRLLRDENNDLKSPMQDFIRKIAPIAPAVIQGLFAKFTGQPAMIGMLDVPKTNYEGDRELNITPEEAETLEAYIADWMKADVDWLALIGKISQMAKDKNPFYFQAKDLLLKM